MKISLTPFHDTVPIFRFPESQQEVLVRILNEIVALSRQAGAQEMTGAYELMVHSLFTQFLYYLKAFHDYNIYETENPQDRLSERIYTVANHIHTHYMDNLTLEGLAKSIYMDPFTSPTSSGRSPAIRLPSISTWSGSATASSCC